MASPLSMGTQSATGCNFAGQNSSGAYAQTLCWLDFSGFTTEYQVKVERVCVIWLIVCVRYEDRKVEEKSLLGAEYTDAGSSRQVGSKWYGNIQNYPISLKLEGGFSLEARLYVTGTGGAARSRYVLPREFPTWDGAFLGNNGFYSGVQGQPALYQASGADGSATTRVELKKIKLQHSGNTLDSGYSIVVADAESTDGGERIDWFTTGAGFRWLPNTPGADTKAGTMGNACQTYAPTPTGSSPTANCVSRGTGTIPGTAMLQTAPGAGDFEVSQTMVGSGQQGVAFGVIFGRANLDVVVEDRILDAQGNATGANFTGSMRHASTGAMTTQTGTSATTASTGARSLPIDTGGSAVTFASQATGANANSYQAHWVCEKLDPSSGQTLRWPTTGTSPTPPSSAVGGFAHVLPGQYIDCTVTYRPPYLTLKKVVQNGSTGATNTPADFTLTAQSSASRARVPGNSTQKRAVAVGNYSFSETGPSEGNAWAFGYDWTDLKCVANTGSTPLSTFSTQRDPQTKVITAGSLNVVANNDVTCTYTNVALEPQLSVRKDVTPSSGTAVQPGQNVTYTLTFNNDQGTAGIAVDHVDHLRDVLDDATFVTGSLRYGTTAGSTPTGTTPQGVTATATGMDTASPRIVLSGTVPRGQVRTVAFTLTVKGDGENRQARQDSGAPLQGYALRNYLTEAGEPAPEECAPTAAGEEPTCTENLIPAWSLTKDARPVDGAWLHRGGNVHYVITAEKINESAQLQNLRITDDLTDVFTTAGWAPDAVVPGGALTRGLYFFDAQNNSLNASGQVNGSAANPVAALAGDAGVPAPTRDSTTGRWTLTSTSTTVPAAAVRAELWFAVEVGNAHDIPGEWPGSAPGNGSTFTNYATATADRAPVQCATGTPLNDSFPQACTTTHEMRANYFTIRKDVQGAGEDLERLPAFGTDPTGLWNMVGHEFEVRDDVDGAPSAAASQKLCRTDYNPFAGSGWDGTWISGGTPDWGQNSATLAAIVDWNNQVEDPSDVLPLCATLYAQSEGSGGQTGRWRSENLPEGDYWLVETKAPNEQISTDGTQRRAVPGVQLMAEPISFRVWTSDDGAPASGQDAPARFGRAQLDVGQGSGAYLDRCQPGSTVAERGAACVNPTGYLMLVKDVVPLQLPLSGGPGSRLLVASGLVLMLVAVLGIAVMRRRASAGST